MTLVSPFAAWRPVPDAAPRVAAPPYDVLSSEEAAEMAKGNPWSFLHVSKPEIDLPAGGCPSLREIHRQGAESFGRLVRERVMIREAKPCFYVYRQRQGDHAQTGLVAGASCKAYRDGRIKRHELTRPDKVEDRRTHIESVNAQTGPVFLAFKGSAEAEARLSEASSGPPLYRFVAPDGVEHTVWLVDDDDRIRAIREAFDALPSLYVADGHHRSEAAAQVWEARRRPTDTGEEPHAFFLSVIFPARELRIMDYNRVIKDLRGLEPERLLELLRPTFVVGPTDDPRPPRPKTWSLYLAGRWHRLEARPGTYPENDPVRRLDVSILQEKVLGPILGIENPRTDPRIDFVGGIRGLGELERRCALPGTAAFALFPTSMDDLMRVADAGLMMPPKSTWFEPKLRSGLLVRSLVD